VYPDAAAALHRWAEAGHPLAVFSSGSVEAQKLLLGHSDAGDLTPLFSAFFDTQIGHKREAESYRRIAEALGREPAGVLFLSDVVEELDAARDAGMRTVLLDRPEDYPQPRMGGAAGGHARVTDFNAIVLPRD
jgi:enolase-phosphatase E1